MPDTNKKLTSETAMDVIQRAMNAGSTAEVYSVGESIPSPTNAEEKRLYSATADSVFSIGYAKYGQAWCDEVNNHFLEEIGGAPAGDQQGSSDPITVLLNSILADADKRHHSRAHADA